MKGSWLVKPVVLLAASLALCAASLAQERGCLETSAMGRMASANSPATLNARKQKAADSYRAQVNFAARMLEIETQDKSAAELLLNLIPKSIDDPRQQVWLELDELPQCPSTASLTRMSQSRTRTATMQYKCERCVAPNTWNS